MKKIATITFHASYNYGSNLQAYALQEFILNLTNHNIKYEIINLRTNNQKEMYKLPFQKKDKKSIIKSIIYFNYKKQLEEKNTLSEKFINEKLNLTHEYKSLEELKKANLNYDYYISGSDQLWNLQALDFDWANFLEFVNHGKKIAYAASFGPKKQQWSEENKTRIKKDLLSYATISVREENSYKNVYELTKIKPEINVDPTMLLKKEDWEKLIDNKPLLNAKYILLYDLHGEKETFDIAKRISKILGIQVVSAKENIKAHLFYPFKKVYNNGPIEFLNLVKHAELILTSSFHGTVFSILLHKPFFSINGLKDFRISTLLKEMSLENRNIDYQSLNEKVKNYKNINFLNADEALEFNRKKSKKFLKKALDLE